MKEYIKKICMLGDASVGKTSLIRRFVQGKYDEKYITTLGTVISKKYVEYPQHGFNMNMQIWDISGQAEFKRIQTSAFRRADGALAVCDMSRPQTAYNLFEWIENLYKTTKVKVPVIVLANKYDLVMDDKKKLTRIKKILDNLNCPLYATSARSGFNVEVCFTNMGKRIGTGPMYTKPITAEELVAMPEIFENPFSFLDYMLDRFSKVFGNEEMSIYMLRSQMESRGNEFTRMPRDEAMNMVNHLIELIYNFKSEEDALNLRMEFMEAYKRCRW